MLRIASIVTICLLSSVGWTAEVGAAADGPPARCRELAAGQSEEALAPCREALAAEPDDHELVPILADLEFRYGDPARSAELWQWLLAHGGWQPDPARGYAMALWRSGRPAEAEPVFREIARRSPSTRASLDLVRYLLGMDRWADAAEAASGALALHRESCELEEALGGALAMLDRDDQAAEHFARAVRSGCPPYGWTRIGPVPDRLDLPAYRALLVPGELISGLDDLDDTQCFFRFQLLARVMVPEAAPAVTDQVLKRRTAQVRIAGIGLLAAVGSQASGSWARLLASDDFVLRKQALRKIRLLDDDAFIPMLEAHLGREELPGNSNLTALALGALLLEGKDPARGQALLEAIPSDDPSYPHARLRLLDLAEAQGDDRLAAERLGEIRAVAPEFWIDPERESRLRAAAGLGDPAPPPVQRGATPSGVD